MRTESVAATHIGHVRENNEDNFLAVPGRGLFAVADGMGGHAAGEVASRIAIEHLQGSTSRLNQDNFDKLFHTIHANLYFDMVRKFPKYTGMGTTLTACSIQDYMLRIAHVGDSRAYLIRRGAAEQLTTDHAGPGGLSNCLGGFKTALVWVQHIERKLFRNDIVVLMTDGLTNYLDAQPNVLTDLGNNVSFKNFADVLVVFALESGGHDNTTVVAVKIT